MEVFNYTLLKRRTVIYASDVLGVVHLKDIYFDCPGAAKFYAWANQVIEMFFMTYVEGAPESEIEYGGERLLSLTGTETEDETNLAPRRRGDMPKRRLSDPGSTGSSEEMSNTNTDTSRVTIVESEPVTQTKVTKFAPIPENSSNQSETQSLGPNKRERKRLHITISEN